MAGWLTKDIEDIGDIVSEFCDHGCDNCYYALRKPLCLGEAYENIKISLGTLKRSLERASNDISNYI